jgi:hypothetical protein
MAIALALETRDQTYSIYGGSAGFTKIIKVTGLVDSELTADKLLEVFSDLERRKTIVSILLDEGEFEPEIDISTERKKEAVILKLAKQLDTGWIMGLIAELVGELNSAATQMSAIAPNQEQISGRIGQEEIARQVELPLAAIAESNIAEGE